MKLFTKIKTAFQGFTEKVKSIPKNISQGFKEGIENIKGMFKGKKKQTQQIKPAKQESLTLEWKDVIDNLISGIQSDFALYYRTATGKFDVTMYNVENLKWQSLDILDGLESATQQQFIEIQSIIDETVNTKPSEMSQDVVDQMFMNINAVLSGGMYVSNTLGEVSTDGTAFDRMDE
nr:MAG TPA: hypothetical protein [Caudoviricetes sp.]